MSYKGYTQLLCKNGHQWTEDAYDYEEGCPYCRELCVWFNEVDQTNGNGDEYYIELEENTPAEFETCKCCGHRKEIKPATYKIPEKE